MFQTLTYIKPIFRILKGTQHCIHRKMRLIPVIDPTMPIVPSFADLEVSGQA
jgi:hypothetical protein